MPHVRICNGCTRTFPPQELRQGRCRACRAERDRARGTRQQRGYTDAWLRMVAYAIRTHPYCAECGTSGDLTGDHIVPLSKGGNEYAIQHPGSLSKMQRSQASEAVSAHRTHVWRL
jgi:5-methylcytosine-specific restriction endonuclease McrA